MHANDTPAPGSYAPKLRKMERKTSKYVQKIDRESVMEASANHKLYKEAKLAKIKEKYERESKIKAEHAKSPKKKTRVRGGKWSTANPKSYLDWIQHHASQTPSPQDYELKSTVLNAKGATVFSTANVPSDVEKKILRANDTPAPDRYNPTQPKKRGGVKISEANPKSDVEWAVYNAQSIPGPGQYTLKSTVLNAKGSCKFSTAFVPSDVEKKILRANDTPAPDRYDPVQQRKRGGVKMSEANPKSDVEWAVYHAKSTPGPGQYTMPSSVLNAKGSCKFSTANVPSDVDVLVAEKSKLPGPAQYYIDDCDAAVSKQTSSMLLAAMD